jgi:hypothetical protein
MPRHLIAFTALAILPKNFFVRDCFEKALHIVTTPHSAAQL